MPARRTLDDWQPLDAERKLAQEMATGLIVQIGDGTLPPANLPETDPRVIRTSFLRALILGRIEGHPPHEKGVRVAGAYLRGDGNTNSDSVALDLDGCEITSDLNLNACRIMVPIRLNMTRMVSMRLFGSRIHAGIEAKGLIASGGLILIDAHASQTLDLLGASLGGSLDASSASFDGYISEDRLLDSGTPRIIDARGIRVGGGLRLVSAKAAGVIDLTGAKVSGDLRLNEACLEIPCSLKPSQVESQEPQLCCLIMDRVSVSGNLEMKKTTARDTVSCRHSLVTGDLLVTGGEYGNVRQDSGTDGPSQMLPTAIDLHGTHIGQSFRFRHGVKVNGKLDLGSMRVELLDDSPCSWPATGGLILDRISIGGFSADGTDTTLRSKWLNRMASAPFSPQPWEECARVLREMGHGAAAREILIEKEKRQRAARRARLWRDGYHEDFLWHSVWDRVLGATVRYGRMPLLALAWLGGLWFAGALVFTEAYSRDALKPNLPQIQRAPEWVLCGVPEGEAVQLAGREEPADGLRAEGQRRIDCFHLQPEGASHPRFNALVYSADALIPVVSLEMQSYWIPDDRKPRGRWARVYLWLHIAAGWALTLLAVAGFSGLIKTDNTR